MNRCIRLLFLILCISVTTHGYGYMVHDDVLEQDTLAYFEAVSRDGAGQTTGAVRGSDFRLGPGLIQSIHGMDFSSGLEGLVPGLDVSPVGAEPGAYVRMLVRGAGSIHAGSDPLIVIDGVPFENASLDAGGYRFSGLSELDAGDIESVEVLKGAVSTAKYGTRGANGVISITTRQGTNGHGRLQLSYRQSVATTPYKYDLLDADQYLNVLNRAYQNSFPGTTDPAPINLHTFEGFYTRPHTDADGVTHQPNMAATNWYDDMHLQGTSHHIRGSFYGGDQRTRYFLGATARRDESFLYGGTYDRANLRLNLSNQVTDRLHVGLNLYLAANRRDVKAKSLFERAQTTALPVYPIQSPVHSGFFWFNQDQPVNIAALNQHSWDKTEGMRTFNTAFVELDLIEGLTLGSRWSWDYQHYRNEDYKHPYVAPAENGLLIIGRMDRNNWTGNNFLTYQTRFGMHGLHAMAGFSVENYMWDGNTIYNPGMTLLFVHSNGESNQRRLAWTQVENYRMYSTYGHVSYDYTGRYLLDLTVRSDASSRFGKENRTHVFPAAQVGWNISEESFLHDNGFINHLQINAGYGISGNALIGNFLHTSSLGHGAPNHNGYYRYGTYPAVVPVSMGNAYLGPEKLTRFDAGINFSLLENKISGQFNYYAHHHTDLLNPVPISMLYGYENNYRWENDGELTSSGIELFLSPQILNMPNGFSWHMDLILATSNTELTRLPDGINYMEGYFNRAYVGEPLGGYYLAEWAGVDPQTGHELIIDPATAQPIDAELLSEEEFRAAATYFPDKTPFPTWYGGLRNHLSFKGFDLSVLFTTRQGHYLLDMGEQSLNYIGSASTGTTRLLDGWTSENPSDIPLLYDTRMSERITSRFLHDASYVRLQELTISYTLPAMLFGHRIGQQVSVYFTGRNLVTWTDFPGYDPNGLYSAYNSMSNLDAGLLMFDPPNPRMFLFGINLGF